MPTTDIWGSAAAQRRLAELQAQLFDARDAAGIQQQDLGNAIGVVARSLRDWERRYDTPGTHHLITWAYALGHRLIITDTLGEAEHRPPPVSLQNGETFQAHETLRLIQPMHTRRKARRLSQHDMGLLLNVTKSTVQRWEYDNTTPPPVALIAYAHRLGFTLDLEHTTTVRNTPQPIPTGP